MSIITGLDIGSSHVKAIIAENKNNNLHALGGWNMEAKGIVAGQIADIDAAAENIATCLHQAELTANRHIDNLIVSINHSQAISKLHSQTLTLGEQPVDEAMIAKLIEETKKSIPVLDNHVLLTLNPVAFNLDDGLRTPNPIGLYGHSLQLTIHYVSVDKNAVRNMNTVLKKCHLQAVHQVFAPHAAAYAVYDEQEAENGVVIIDLGAETVGISIFKNQVQIFACTLPFGMNIVRSDIASFFGMSRKDAEHLISRLGSAVVSPKDSNNFFTFHPVGSDSDSAQHQQDIAGFNGVIAERMNEIFSKIEQKLAQAGVTHLRLWNMVFTGGGSQLEGLELAAHNYFKGNTRVGMPQGVAGITDTLQYTGAAVVTGLLHHFNDQTFSNYTTKKPTLISGNRNENPLNRFLNWLKSNF